MAQLPEAVALVPAVLKAKGEYEVLGACPDYPPKMLQHCYIKRSAQVHPDENPHPDAKRAFQRIAQAWLHLGVQQSRRRDDIELLPEGICLDNEMNLERALMMYAMATANISPAHISLDDDPPVSSHDSNQVRPSLGVSPLRESAVRVACAARHWASQCMETAAGLPTTRAIAHRCALMQGTGCFNPELRASLDDEIDEVYKSVQPFQHATSSVGSSITNLLGLNRDRPSHEGVGTSASHKDAFDSASNSSSPESSPPRAPPLANGISSLAARCKDLGNNMTESIGNTVQVSLSQVPPCFGTRSRCLALDKDQLIEAGTKVKIVNLRSATNLNGKIGEVLSFDHDSGRYRVKIFSLKISPACHASSTPSSISHDDMKLIKGNNLQMLQNSVCSQPVVASQFF